ncbi:hypothetical protein [Tenacibaculum sp. 190524A05c]|uniref:hypothetical protein n=1 Tax=Tenacibaculum platacis TaxID=3137852 RepID=UPI0032B2B2AF
MKKIFYLILILMSFQSCKGQLKCSDLKNGIFELKSETGTTIIERKGNIQIEKNKGLNYYSDVEWISNCKYELKNHRNHKGELEKEELNKIYTVEIIEIMKDYVRIKTSANYSDKSLERTLKIIEIK